MLCNGRTKYLPKCKVSDNNRLEQTIADRYEVGDRYKRDCKYRWFGVGKGSGQKCSY